MKWCREQPASLRGACCYMAANKFCELYDGDPVAAEAIGHWASKCEVVKALPSCGECKAGENVQRAKYQAYLDTV